jgi:hypothetical protein
MTMKELLVLVVALAIIVGVGVVGHHLADDGDDGSTSWSHSSYELRQSLSD